MPFLPPSRMNRRNEETAPANDARQRRGPASNAPADVSTFQVRRMLATHRDASLVVAQRIRRVIERVGRTEVNTALGDEAQDLVATYEALRTFVLTIDPNADFPNLPE